MSDSEDNEQNDGPSHLDDVDICSFDTNVYTLVMLRFTHWMDGHGFSSHPVLSLSHAVVLWSINLCLQGGICLALLSLADDMGEPWENSFFLRHYNTSIFDATSTLSMALDEPSITNEIHSDILEKCREAIGVPRYFYFMLMFLWLLRNFAEIEDAFLSFGQLCTIRRRRTWEDRIFNDDDEEVIEMLDCWMVVVLIVFVPLTRLLISFLITYCGMKFILMQNNELTMILKALTMQFVTQIDEMLLALITSRCRDAVGSLKMRMSSLVADPGRYNNLWDGGLGGLIYLGALGIAVYLILNVVFAGVCDFRRACSIYDSRFSLPEFPVRDLLASYV
jgi:hypothetical protein